jgi:hypothetical protein
LHHVRNYNKVKDDGGRRIFDANVFMDQYNCDPKLVDKLQLFISEIALKIHYLQHRCNKLENQRQKYKKHLKYLDQLPHGTRIKNENNPDYVYSSRTGYRRLIAMTKSLYTLDVGLSKLFDLQTRFTRAICNSNKSVEDKLTLSLMPRMAHELHQQITDRLDNDAQHTKITFGNIDLNISKRGYLEIRKLVCFFCHKFDASQY